MRTFFQDLKRDDGTDIVVEYGYEDHGSCVVIMEAWLKSDENNPDAPVFELTDAEHERMAAWILEHRYWDDQAA